jgi:hypothetical protein
LPSLDQRQTHQRNVHQSQVAIRDDGKLASSRARTKQKISSSRHTRFENTYNFTQFLQVLFRQMFAFTDAGVTAQLSNARGKSYDTIGIHDLGSAGADARGLKAHVRSEKSDCQATFQTLTGSHVSKGVSRDHARAGGCARDDKYFCMHSVLSIV